jgi:putative flippase GtrA
LAIDRAKFNSLIKEFGRYLVVGGTAALLDWGMLYLSYNYIFTGFGSWRLTLATATGFIAGLILNYILSLIWVFKSARESNKGKTVGAFIIFAVIGAVGLLLTEGGMHFGCMLVGEEYYMFVKVFVTGIVLIWNYAARKILIFKDDKKEWTEKQQSSSERDLQA